MEEDEEKRVAGLRTPCLVPGSVLESPAGGREEEKKEECSE